MASTSSWHSSMTYSVSDSGVCVLSHGQPSGAMRRSMTVLRRSSAACVAASAAAGAVVVSDMRFPFSVRSWKMWAVNRHIPEERGVQAGRGKHVGEAARREFVPTERRKPSERDGSLFYSGLSVSWKSLSLSLSIYIYYFRYCSGRNCLKTTIVSLIGWIIRDFLMKSASLMK